MTALLHRLLPDRAHPRRIRLSTQVRATPVPFRRDPSLAAARERLATGYELDFLRSTDSRCNHRAQ